MRPKAEKKESDHVMDHSRKSYGRYRYSDGPSDPVIFVPFLDFDDIGIS